MVCFDVFDMPLNQYLQGIVLSADSMRKTDSAYSYQQIETELVRCPHRKGRYADTDRAMAVNGLVPVAESQCCCSYSVVDRLGCRACVENATVYSWLRLGQCYWQNMLPEEVLRNWTVPCVRFLSCFLEGTVIVGATVAVVLVRMSCQYPL